MFKKCSVFILMITLFSVSITLSSVTAQTSTNAEVAAKLRGKVSRIGTGQNARVEVELRDRTRVRGYISSMDQDSFTVVERETGASRTVAYVDAAEVKRPGGLSTKSWLIIGGAAAASGATWLIVKPAVCDGGAQTRGIC